MNKAEPKNAKRAPEAAGRKAVAPEVNLQRKRTARAEPANTSGFGVPPSIGATPLPEVNPAETPGSGMTPLADAGAAAMAAVAAPVVAAVEAAALTAATVASNVMTAAGTGANMLGGGSPSEASPAAEEESKAKGSGENDLV